MTDWGTLIKELRLERRISRPAIAEISGVSAATIAHYENHTIAHPNIHRIEALLEAMGYELDAMRSG
jgi:transcriptional regulator with XRE-family HTH domain